jgi:DNA-binding response OmpR family regulator
MSGILFIDAEQPFADQTTSALRARGFSVTMVDDGKKALDVAAADRPDVIVLCVELPRMSGYSVCNRLKKDNHLKGIPLVITSKEATAETFAQHKKLMTRADDYLIKPFSEAELVEIIEALLARPRSLPPPRAATPSFLRSLRSWLTGR